MVKRLNFIRLKEFGFILMQKKKIFFSIKFFTEILINLLNYLSIANEKFNFI